MGWSMKKNDSICAFVDGLGSNGEGIIRHDGVTFFVPSCLPGEKVRFKILKIKDGIGFGKAEEILAPAQERVAPKCGAFLRCGGCRLQHVDYEKQREIKSNIVRDCLKKIAGIDVEVPLAVKSNLLYDALTLINCSVELPIGDKFSALVYSQFPWWKWGEADNEYCVRFLSLGAEGRWWFAPRPQPATVKRQERDRLVGHFVGVYAESGMWDFQFKRDICRQGEFWSVGVSYGYSMPIGRRLNMEFSLSVGYASIPYRGYTPSTDYEILWRDNENAGCWGYIGPTKAQVSLVVPIKASQKKGGCR